MRHTKKYMVENFAQLERDCDLLQLYLYDTRTGAKPAAVESYRDEHGRVRVQLWLATGVRGSYVVIWNGNANVFYLEDINRRLADDHSVYSLGTRICLERLTAVRNQLLQESA